MLDTMPAARMGTLTYRLADDATVTDDGAQIVFASPRDAFALTGLSDMARAEVAALQRARTIDARLEDAVLAADGAVGLALVYAAVGRLARAANVRLEAGPGIATLVPISSGFAWSWPPLAPHTALRLSRFAYVHRLPDGRFVVESPCAHARLELHAPTAFEAVAHLARGASPDDLARIGGLSAENAMALVALLAGGGFAGVLDGERLAEDDDPTLRQWDFHDLLFHSRSRLGRHDDPMGGTFRFVGSLPPKPVVKQLQGLSFVDLPQPDLGTLAAFDPSLLSVMEWRASVRSDARQIITLDQLATFLYRVARLKQRMPVGRFGEVSKRPFPNGGASYELELYLNVDRCNGLVPGFYLYHPEQHRLYLIRAHDADTLGMLTLAHYATGQQVHPQILITIAARFQRVAWKYTGMAYATILKNTGALYATMYYVATAMGLAPCGVGLGDSDAFARAAGTDYYEETSVGEFILCGSA